VNAGGFRGETKGYGIPGERYEYEWKVVTTFTVNILQGKGVREAAREDRRSG